MSGSGSMTPAGVQVELQHGRVPLHLHALVEREGQALLLLHGLYDSAATWGPEVEAWSGSVYALDFSGHGLSGAALGGAYTPEILAGDADMALEAVGPACIAGVGVGAYVALLLAGGRPDQVAAALLAPGRGLAGAGAIPDFDAPFDGAPDPQPHSELGGRPRQPRTDPDVRCLELDFRPVDYIATFAAAAKQLVLLEDDAARPPWWETARGTGNVRSVRGDLAAGLAELARFTTA